MFIRWLRGWKKHLNFLGLNLVEDANEIQNKPIFDIMKFIEYNLHGTWCFYWGLEICEDFTFSIRKVGFDWILPSKLEGINPGIFVWHTNWDLMLYPIFLSLTYLYQLGMLSVIKGCFLFRVKHVFQLLILFVNVKHEFSSSYTHSDAFSKLIGITEEFVKT